MFLSVVIAMYTRFITIIGQLNTTDNLYVTGIVSIVAIALGVVIMFNIIDAFTPSPAP